MPSCRYDMPVGGLVGQWVSGSVGQKGAGVRLRQRACDISVPDIKSNEHSKCVGQHAAVPVFLSLQLLHCDDR